MLWWIIIVVLVLFILSLFVAVLYMKRKDEKTVTDSIEESYYREGNRMSFASLAYGKRVMNRISMPVAYHVNSDVQ